MKNKTYHMRIVSYYYYVAAIVCFMAKSAFFWGGGFGPSSVKRGRTHIVLG